MNRTDWTDLKLGWWFTNCWFNWVPRGPPCYKYRYNGALKGFVSSWSSSVGLARKKRRRDLSCNCWYKVTWLFFILKFSVSVTNYGLNPIICDLGKIGEMDYIMKLLDKDEVCSRIYFEISFLVFVWSSVENRFSVRDLELISCLNMLDLELACSCHAFGCGCWWVYSWTK